MKFIVTFPSEWRYRDRKRGPQVVAAGTYRVPEEMKEAVAEMAIAACKAQRAASRTPMRRKPLKAPQDTSLGPAPENKSLLD